MIATKAPPRHRTCRRCGQPLNTQTDSWEMQTSADGRYAQGIRHVTCPTSPALRDLPATPPAPDLPAPVVPGAPVYVTIAQAAEILCVSKDTIRNRIRAGALPAQRIKDGQTVLMELRDVLALLEPVPVGKKV